MASITNSNFTICTGPAVIGGKLGKLLVGVTSFGLGNPAQFGPRWSYYVDVFHYAEWIMDTMNKKRTGRFFSIHKFSK